MPKPTDTIMPILQRIQSDLAEVKRELSETKHHLGAKMDAVTERMDGFEDYFTYTMGLTQRNKADIARLGSQHRAMLARIDALGDKR
jgi:hypothetical protein